MILLRATLDPLLNSSPHRSSLADTLLRPSKPCSSTQIAITPIPSFSLRRWDPSTGCRPAQRMQDFPAYGPGSLKVNRPEANAHYNPCLLYPRYLFPVQMQFPRSAYQPQVNRFLRSFDRELGMSGCSSTYVGRAARRLHLNPLNLFM